MDGFFAISGYLITASWLRSVWSYFQKRTLRIYPGFLVVPLLCAVVVGPLGADSSAAYFREFPFFGFLRHALLLDKLDLPLTFLHSAVPGQVNGSLWTIKIEFECNLLAAALELLTLAPHVRYSLPGSAAEHLRFFSAFLVGMIFFLYQDRTRYRPLLLAGAALALATRLHFDVRHVQPVGGAPQLRAQTGPVLWPLSLRMAHPAAFRALFFGAALFGAACAVFADPSRAAADSCLRLDELALCREAEFALEAGAAPARCQSGNPESCTGGNLNRRISEGVLLSDTGEKRIGHRGGKDAPNDADGLFRGLGRRADFCIIRSVGMNFVVVRAGVPGRAVAAGDFAPFQFVQRAVNADAERVQTVERMGELHELGSFEPAADSHHIGAGSRKGCKAAEVARKPARKAQVGIP